MHQELQKTAVILDAIACHICDKFGIQCERCALQDVKVCLCIKGYQILETKRRGEFDVCRRLWTIFIGIRSDYIVAAIMDHAEQKDIGYNAVIASPRDYISEIIDLIGPYITSTYSITASFYEDDYANAEIIEACFTDNPIRY